VKPLEALERAMFYISGVCSTKTLNVPGAVINRLSAEVREALSKLKSSDIDGDTTPVYDIRYWIDPHQYEDTYRKPDQVKDRLDFDKKILKNG
jgi:hypothetical protein